MDPSGFVSTYRLSLADKLGPENGMTAVNSRLYRRFLTVLGFPKPEFFVSFRALIGDPPLNVMGLTAIKLTAIKLTAIKLTALGLTATPAIAQPFPHRSPSAIPVPLPSRNQPSLSGETPLAPAERELLESFAPELGFGDSAFSAFNPPSGPLRVPDARIPIGNAGSRSDVSSFTTAQMPWNDNPPHHNVGGGGPQVSVTPAFKAPSLPPSTLFPQPQASRAQALGPVTAARSLPSPPSQSSPYVGQPMRQPRLGQTHLGQPHLGPPHSGQPAFNHAALASPSPWRYRVFIALPPQAAQANQLQAQLRLWASDSFVTVVRGQRVLQLGNFRDRTRADLMFEQLRRYGFWPQIEVTAEG